MDWTARANPTAVVKRQASEEIQAGPSRKRARTEPSPVVFRAVREWPIRGEGLLAQSNLKDIKLSYNQSTDACILVEATDSSTDLRYTAQVPDYANPALVKVVQAARHTDLKDHVDFSIHGSIRDGCLLASVHVELKESLISARLTKRALSARAALIDLLFPLSEDAGLAKAVSVPDFYQMLNRPPPRPEGVIPHIETMPECTLLPFQSASVSWLLSKEGVHLDAHLEIQPLSNDQLPANPLWRSVSSQGGEEEEGKLWIDSLSGNVSLREPAGINGKGMLLEEMGLGKTVEIIALISLHRQPDRHLLPTFRDLRLEINIQPSSLTLILCPPTIINQWVAEFARHAPSLRTHIYTGVAKLASAKIKSDKEVQRLLRYDVILCSFDVLAKEVYYSRPQQERRLRTGKKELRRSPLCQIEWLRICMDEVQMMGSSASQSSEVASTLHRKFSFALSGTPLQKSIQDLRPLLGFLQLWPSDYEKTMCQQLLLPSRLPILQSLLDQLCIRTTKDAVSAELSVPKQRFHLVQVTQDPVERVRYTNQYTEALSDLTRVEVDPFGEKRPVGRHKILHWLTVLRQTCSLPPIVSDTTSGPKQIQTLQQTLQHMIKENRSQQHTNARARVAAMVRRGHLVSRDREDCEGLERSIAIFDLAIAEIKALLAATAASTSEVEVESEASATTEKSAKYEYSLLLHSALFYKGNAFFTMGSTFGEQEVASYDEAERVRNQMLANEKAAFDREVARNQSSRGAMGRRIKQLQSAHKCIIACESSKELVGGISQLDKLSTVAIKWRQELLNMLCRSVKDEDIAPEEADAYYGTQAATQETIDLYLDFYKQILADIRELLTGRRSALADEFSSAVGLSIRQQGQSKFKKLLDTGSTKNFIIDPDDPGAALFFDLLRVRVAARGGETIQVKRVLQSLAFGSLRSTDTDVIEKALHNADEGCTAMEKELDRDFDPLATTRFQYFVRLQAVSDSVGDFNIAESKTKTFAGEIKRCEEEEGENARKAAQLRSQGVYLGSLASQNSENAVCTICDEAIEKAGILTACGHIFCRKCLMQWFRASRTCPLCKSRIPNDSYFKVRTSGELQVEQDRQLKTTAAKSTQTSQGSASDLVYMPSAELAQIQAMQHGAQSVGVKIDTIVKHIVHLRTVETDAKVLLFSAWAAGLEVCMAALAEAGIGFVRLDKGKRSEAVTKFANDPEAAVFILNAQSSAAGLNLIVAKTVIFFEPLLNPSIEQQAVGRIHRIGQTEVTHVFQYFVNESVESRIVHAQAASGQSLFVRGKEEASIGTDAPLKADEVAGGASNADVANLLLEQEDVGKLIL